MPIKNKSAIVIGSGFGGLAAAIRLQASGIKTKIFESRDLPGGRAYVYRDNGFVFDAGPTVITAPLCIEELFTLCGKKMESYVEMIPINPFYRLFWEDGSTFDYCNDEERLMEQIRSFNGADVDGYRKFEKYAKEVFDIGYTQLSHVPFLKFSDMVRVAPDLIRLKAYRSVYSIVSSYIKDERLRQAFSFNSLLIGGNPFKASAIYSLIHPLEKKWGVYFPKGGTNALVNALCQLFCDMGGEITYSSPVEEIIATGPKVTGVKVRGQNHHSDYVVCNSDVTYTYQNLLRNVKSVKSRAARLTRSRHSMSLFVIYFGTNKSFDGLVHHNVMFGPRYRELLSDIFDRGVLADDFSLYVHAPSLTDSTLAPPGKQSFYALAPVPNMKKFQKDWSKIAPNYADRILSYLDSHYMPGLKASIETTKTFSPQDFATQLNAHQGAAFSLEPTLTQSAWFRVHNADPDVKGLYFVGAGTHPGAGVPGVIDSAKATCKVILDQNGLHA